jgi:hypothetical protein
MYRYDHLDLEWETKELVLPGIGIKLDVPPRARICHLGQSNQFDWEKENSAGICVPQPNFKTGGYDFIIARKKDLEPAFYDTFVMGHEEGHLLNYIGGLEILYDQSKHLGLEFPFMNIFDLKKSDESAKKIHQKRYNHQDFARVWKKDNLLKESLADVAGLVTLIKQEFPDKMVEIIRKEVEQRSLKPLEKLFDMPEYTYAQGKRKSVIQSIEPKSTKLKTDLSNLENGNLIQISDYLRKRKD